MVWKPNVTVAAVIEQGGRYLLVEELVEGRPVLNQPAGHLEQGESLPQAIIREVWEETGFWFEPKALVAVQLYRATDSLTFLRFAFAGNVSHRDPNHHLDEAILANHWLTRAEIEAMPNKLRSPLVLESIAAYESGHRYPLQILRSLE
ncbi:MAG: NUDIX hydrolase [Methylohalobius sp.]|nr:NUDIX hydrolase [Methylohalobius sp.]